MRFLIFFLFQKEGDKSKRDTVVLLLQDMLEVVTRDMMVNEIRLVLQQSIGMEISETLDN